MITPFDLIALYCLGLLYFLGVAVIRVRAFRARFMNLPMSGDTLPGGLPGVSLEFKK